MNGNGSGRNDRDMIAILSQHFLEEGKKTKGYY
jgi:hypothetical protein